MTEKTKAIIILIAVAIAYYIFVGVIQAVSLYLLYDNGILDSASPLNEFITSINYLFAALAQVIFIFVLFKVIKTGKECTNGKFNYNFDKFFYTAFALGILNISYPMIFSHLPYWDSRNIADLIISE